MADQSIRKPPSTDDKLLQELTSWAYKEFQELAKISNEPPYVVLTQQNVALLRPRQGMIVYADGTNWDPGYGEGVYFRNSAGVWVPAVAARSPVPASFLAHKNGTDQTAIASATHTKMTFTTEVFDFGGYYDAANSKWTPPAGIVAIASKVLFTAGIVDQEVYINEHYVGGAVVQRGAEQRASGTGFLGGVALTLASTDGTKYYESYAYGSGAGNKTVSGGVGVSFFAGVWIGPNT